MIWGQVAGTERRELLDQGDTVILLQRVMALAKELEGLGDPKSLSASLTCRGTRGPKPQATSNRKDTMIEQIEYKKYKIDYVYDCSEGYDEINYYNVWTPDGLDLCADKLATIDQAKAWIDDHIKGDK